MHQIWDEAPIIILSQHHEDHAALNLALHHGIPEALKKLHQITQDQMAIGDSSSYKAHELIRETVDLSHIKREERYDRPKVNRWFISKKPEQFHFDPISRLFVIAPARP